VGVAADPLEGDRRLGRRALLGGGAALALGAAGFAPGRAAAKQTTDLGIVVALRQEQRGLAELLSDASSVRVGRLTVRLGLLAGVPVALVVSGPGKGNAAVGTTLLAERFGARRLLWIGTAGAFGRDLHVGDVVVADRLFQWDFDQRPFKPRFEIGDEGPRGFPTDPHLRREVVAAARAFLADDLPTAVPAGLRRRLGIRSPRVVVGTIASGDSFTIGRAQRRAIGSMPRVEAIDFEGAACAQAGYDLGIPTAVVRSISDVPGSHDADVFATFLARAAGAYSTGIVRRLAQRPMSGETR
jgi:adenosylhomocysteine nucleosidase